MKYQSTLILPAVSGLYHDFFDVVCSFKQLLCEPYYPLAVHLYHPRPLPPYRGRTDRGYREAAGPQQQSYVSHRINRGQFHTIVVKTKHVYFYFFDVASSYSRNKIVLCLFVNGTVRFVRPPWILKLCELDSSNPGTK